MDPLIEFRDVSKIYKMGDDIIRAANHINFKIYKGEFIAIVGPVSYTHLKVSALSGVANIPEIMVQADLINQILHTDYIENAGINEFEYIRKNLRDLMKYIPKGSKIIYDTNFDDEILSMDWNESDLENDDLKN